MVVRQVPKDNWCVICDEQLSEVEISHDGSLTAVQWSWLLHFPMLFPPPFQQNIPWWF